MRIYPVTGIAGQMGVATKRLLEAAGHRVIGIDLHDAEVITRGVAAWDQHHLARAEGTTP